MAILSKGNTFATGEQVTAAKLNNLVDNATFASDAVDNSTTALDGNGKIIVKDGGITSAKLNLNANVGINTSSPEATLHVKDIASTQPCILVEGASPSEGDIAVIDGESLQIGHWSGSSFTERIKIDSSGNLVISNIPTSASGLASGTIYSDSGTLKIVS